MIDLVDQIRRDSGNLRLWSVQRETGPVVGLPPGQEIHLWSDPEGCLTVSSLTQGGCAHYRFRQDERFTVDLLPDNHLIVHAHDEVSPHTIDHFIADQVIPRAMAGEGQHILHSGAIRHADRAILVMGASGRGKSTLATSFHLAGDDIIGDDAVIAGWQRDVPVASAVYRSLRLLPDSIEALLPATIETDMVADYTPKRRVSVPVGNLPAYRPLPIAAIFVIGEPCCDARLDIRELSASEACMALVENAFALDPADTRQAHARLVQASALARSVPSFAIEYPRDYSWLPAVRAAMLARLV